MPAIKPFDCVRYMHYGAEKTGVVARVGNSGIVHLTDGRWLHAESAVRVEPCYLTFEESGMLCHALMQAINAAGGVEKQSTNIIALYERLAACNDRLKEAR